MKTIVKTYLLKKNKIIDDLSLVEDNRNNFFFEISDKEALIKHFSEGEMFYLNGAIFFQHEGMKILEFKHWDLIDQLWSYFIDLILEYAETGKQSEFYFPDQPLQVTLSEETPKHVLFTIGENKYLLPKTIFKEYVVPAAEMFFTSLIRHSSDTERYRLVMENIQILKIKL